jgi:hypothetical protein
MAVSRNWSITPLDISDSFLHGTLDETVYMQQPPGFVDPSKLDFVCRLKKSIYSLKQAPRLWNKCLTDALLSFGFHRSKTNSSLYHFTSAGGHKLLCLIYVDDIFVLGSDYLLLSQLIGHL